MDDQRAFVSARGSFANPNSTLGLVAAIDKTTLVRTDLATGQRSPIAITLLQGLVVFQASGDGHLWTVQPSGAGLKDNGVVAANNPISDMVGAGDALVWLLVQGQVQRAAPGQPPMPLGQVAAGGGRMAIANGVVAFAGQQGQTGAFYSVTLGAPQIKTLGSNLKGALGVAVVGTTGYVTEPQGGAIHRAPLDGSKSLETIVTGQSFPWALTTDGKKLYWVDHGSNDITVCPPGALFRADLDGKNVTKLTDVPCPAALAVDALSVYVVSHGTEASSDGFVARIGK